MDKQTIIIAVLTGLLASSEYLSQSKKFEANGWYDVIKNVIAIIAAKFSAEQKK